MPKFKPYNMKQDKMVVLNFEEQLQSGTFEHAIHYLIENKLDLSVFYPRYQNEETGRPAYDPAILLKIILFAYSKGITSSREIQWCCETNIIFKALACDTVPHFTTIAAFVSERSKEIEAMFEQILLICFQQGLLGNELFAIDGCKMSSNASKEWSGSFKELKAKRKKLKRQIRYLMNAQKTQDASESRDEARQQRTQQTIETLDKACEKIDQFLKSNSPRMGQGKTHKEIKSNITDNESAKMTTSKGTIQGYNGIAAVDKKHQVIVDAQAIGHGQEHHTLIPVLESLQARFKRLGISDNILKEDVVVTADTGYANEANMKYLHDNQIDGYIPDNRFRSRDPRFQDQKKKYPKPSQAKPDAFHNIPASEFAFNPVDLTCVCPAGQQISFRNQREDKQGNLKAFFEGRLLQCRNCDIKQQCMENPSSADHRKGNGRQVSFIIEKGKRKANFTDWMKHRVDSIKGKEIYSHRMSVVEPVFANICSTKKLNRFSLRSRKKVQAQWQLYSLVHNIEKLMNYGNMAA